MKTTVIAVLVLTGLLIGTSPSIAQRATVRTSASDAVAIHAQSRDLPAAAMPCGWYAPSPTAYYNHCGQTPIRIDVEFWWGMGATRTICVRPGATNLSAHPLLGDGLITYAYYNSFGC